MSGPCGSGIWRWKIQYWSNRAGVLASATKRPKPLDEMTDDNWDNFYKDHDKSWHVLINQTTWLIDKWLQKYLWDLDDYLGVLLDCKRLIDQVCFKLFWWKLWLTILTLYYGANLWWWIKKNLNTLTIPSETILYCFRSHSIMTLCNYREKTDKYR